MSLIVAEDLHKTYCVGEVRTNALKGVSFVVEPARQRSGRVLALLQGRLEKGLGRLLDRINSDDSNSYRGETFQTTFYDGYLSIKPSANLALEARK
jgi:hypothetical protein